MAAYVQRQAISAPTNPSVTFAIAPRSTSSDNFIFEVWILIIYNLPFSSGLPIYIYLSKRPNLQRAGSSKLYLFVAPITTTFPLF